MVQDHMLLIAGVDNCHVSIGNQLIKRTDQCAKLFCPRKAGVKIMKLN